MSDTNCCNCGAPAESSVCSYCKTPQFRKLVVPLLAVSDGGVRVDVLYGWTPLRPEHHASFEWR